jgi:hypothetical protein
MAVLAPFANFVVLGELVTPGDAAATARDIQAAEGLFRAGVVSLYAVMLLDIVVAAALYRVLAPAGRCVAALAGWLRVAYAAAFLVALTQLSGLSLHDAAGTLDRIETFRRIWDTSYVLFAAHLLLVGYLAYRSGFVPRVIGALVVVSGAGYLIDAAGTLLGQDLSFGEGTFIGEVVLMVWLLGHGLRGGRAPATAPAEDVAVSAR